MAQDKEGPMISKEYRQDYAKRPPDWLKNLVAEECYEDESLPEGSKKKPKKVANVNKMIQLAKVNGIDASKFNSDAYNMGQKIMNINNKLRAAARKRHGLKRLNGEFQKIRGDNPFLQGQERTHDESGNVIIKNDGKGNAKAA